eukprot:TRINITY_DN8772_c0_g2_i1.p2 TRINITY_DN8772_c0_g2~~TRINITY_DN8772_c0_g2_i1.p2  ORF type:complete len:430 (-),score=59.60 TRINITY_DN8772_c0_g2_i1:650-1939(-)
MQALLRRSTNQATYSVLSKQLAFCLQQSLQQISKLSQTQQGNERQIRQQSTWLFGGRPKDVREQAMTPITPPPNFGFQIVPEKMAYVVERFGSFYKVLVPGLHLLIPIVDRVSYVHSLKELSIPVGQATAITKDNVSITVDGMLYVKVMDAEKASYGVDNPMYAVVQLAQTTMRSELGKITLDKTFEEREALNRSMVLAINQAADPWGLQCMRFEIKDITPPPGITKAMELQAEAERKKRAQVLESEGQRQAKINIAEGQKQEIILGSQAAQQDTINRALGEAEGMLKQAEATSKGLRLISQALLSKGGNEAAVLRVAERYIEAFGNIAKTGNTLVIPADTNNPGAMIAQAMTMYKTLADQQKQQSGVKPDANDGEGNDSTKSSDGGQTQDVQKQGGTTESLQQKQQQILQQDQNQQMQMSDRIILSKE